MATYNNAIPTTTQTTASATVVRKRDAVAPKLSTSQADNGQKSDSKDQLQKLVSQMNENAQVASRKLTFSIDSESGRTIVKVIDGHTDKVIRQIPSEEMLALARSLKSAEAHIFSAKA